MKPITLSKTADGKYWIKKYEFEGMKAEAKAVALMPDGDIVIAGSIKPKEKDAKLKGGGLVAKFDKNGNVKWVMILGGGSTDESNDVKIAPNGDIIVAGETWSFGASAGNWPDAWVLRLDSEGNVKWQKTYGGSKEDEAYAVAVAPNGDIIVAGGTRSLGWWNVFVARLSPDGELKWFKTYGGSSVDKAKAVAVTPNGDIIVAGYTDSFGAGGWDAWVLRLDGNGNVKWQKTYGGGGGNDKALAVALASNGDIIVAGYTDSFGASDRNLWVLRLDLDGNIKWEKAYFSIRRSSIVSIDIDLNQEFIVLSAESRPLCIDHNGNVICSIDTYVDALKITEDNVLIAVECSFDELKLIKIPMWEKVFHAPVRELKSITMPTNAIVRNTRCKVKKAGGIFSRFKVQDSVATIKTTFLKLKEKKEFKLQTRDHIKNSISTENTCPGYLINNRCYIVKAMVMDEAGLKSALEELDKELSGIKAIQPLPDKIIVHPFEGIIEGENLFVTKNAIARSPLEPPTLKPLKHLEEILESIKSFVVPTHKEDKTSKEPEIKAKSALEISEDSEAIKSKPAEETKTVEGFPSALLGRYEPLEFLGEGGFAKVFKARRKEDGKVVALKIPRIDEKTSGLFIKEVAAWYNLNHENIVRLYRADILPIPYLEMEFIEGVEVDGKLVRDLEKYPKPVPEDVALKLITGIAKGLAHAHSRGIYHLDLKPLNVLLKADLTPKITDWGLAKISARSSLSRHYGYSPLYAAPEQLDEETFGMPDHRTDIYQLGLILYELLMGELPYKATSPGALAGKILYAKPKPVSEFKPELKKFNGIFERLLAKRKEDRYQSVEEFLNALEFLGELEREKEELRKTSTAMRRSRSREEFERLKIESIRKTVKIAILSAKLNDKAELLAALDDLKFYTRENLDDLLSAIAQVELLLEEGIPVSSEVEERVRALVLRIEGEVSK